MAQRAICHDLQSGAQVPSPERHTLCNSLSANFGIWTSPSDDELH